MRKSVSITLVFAAVQLLGAGSALAQSSLPPGNSAVDEYTEAVPHAGGDRPSTGDNSQGGGGAALPAQSQAALQAQGKDGSAAAKLAQDTAPSSGGSPQAPDVPGSDGFGALPFLLGLSALAAAAVGVARWRRGGGLAS